MRRIRLFTFGVALTGVALATGLAAQGASTPASPPKIVAASNPHDLDGVWWTPGYDRKFRTVDGQLPPFTERGRREWEHNVKADEAGMPVADAPTGCLPHGIPRLLASPYPIQIITVGDQMTWIHEVNRNQRFIYMNESHPAHLKKTYLGHSVGRWEGDTLVIDTAALNDRTRIDEEGITHSDQLQVVERIRKVEINGVLHLESLITITDPVMFTAPWTTRRIALSPLAGGPALLWQDTETLIQAGASPGDGDRKTISSFALYADGTTYRQRDLATTRQHRVGGAFSTFAKSARTWNATYKEKLTDEVWVDANDNHRAITRYVYDPSTGNVLERFKPVQNASSGPSETYQYDARGLFVAVETNEVGHVRELEYEYGTGTKLTTKGPNEATCAINCPPGETCLPKEQHTIRVDGIGREIEQWDTVSDDGCTYFYHQRATNSYFDAVTATVPASTTHKTRLDVETSVWTEEKTEVDGRGRPIKTTVFVQGTAPFDQITTYSYSNNGPLVAVEVPDPSVNTAARVAYAYTYDSLNRPVTIRRPDATSAQDKSGVDIAYDGLTKTTKEETGVAGGNKALTKTITDRFGRLIQVHEQLTENPDTWAVTTYGYGPDDLVTSVVDPQSGTTSLVHDFAGRRTEITRHGRTWKYGYDKNGNMISEQVPGSPNPPITDINYTTTIAYDHLDRPLSKVVGQRDLPAADQALFGGSTEAFWYDLNGNMKGHFRLWQSYAPNNSVPILERSNRVDNQGNWWHWRNGFNLAGYALVRDYYQDHYLFGGVRKTYYYDELSPGGNSTFSFTNYDARGLPANMYAYTGVGAIQNNIGVQTRNVAGLVMNRRSTPPSGPMSYVESNWTYDKLGRVTSQAVQKSPSPSDVARQELEYLGNDDPKWLDHWLGTSSKRLNFTFDKRHQLTSAASTTAGYFDANYVYGSAGRFMRATEAQAAPAPSGSGVMPRDVNYVYGGADPEQVTALVNVGGGSSYATFTYDLAGNQTTRCLGPVSSPSCTGTLLEYVYDGNNRLRRVTKKQTGVTNGSEEYWYDYDGSRIAIVKRDGLGNKTELVTFTADSEAHYNGVGAIQHVYSHLSMGTPVARIKRTGDTTTETEYQFHGLANSTIAAVASDGTINARFVYAPFGSVVETTDAGGSTAGTAVHQRRFNEKYTDELSDLSYYGARYYDKGLIAWTQADPLYSWRPDAAKVSGARRGNLYSFSLNNPVRYLDPDGRDSRKMSVVIQDVSSKDSQPITTRVKQVLEKSFAPKGGGGGDQMLQAASNGQVTAKVSSTSKSGPTNAKGITYILADLSDTPSTLRAKDAGGEPALLQLRDGKDSQGATNKRGGDKVVIAVNRLAGYLQSQSLDLSAPGDAEKIDAAIEALAVHEGGHALGLSHDKGKRTTAERMHEDTPISGAGWTEEDLERMDGELDKRAQ